MDLFKVWFHLNDLDIDVSLLVPANSLKDAIERAKNYAEVLHGKLKVVDNVHVDTKLKR
jgi:hypothetical protein